MHAHDFPTLGITTDPTNGTPVLRVWSANATAMSCVVVDDQGEQTLRLPMNHTDAGVWEVADRRLVPGSWYALAVDGPRELPHRFDPDALVLDPYARHVRNFGTEATPRWFGQIVAEEPFDWGDSSAPRTSLRDTVIYELHVKGFTKLAHFVPEPLRGTYAGLADPNVIAHLKRLGVTAVELLPVHAFAHERHLREDGRTNYWGYNTVGFFAPHADYATQAAQAAGPEAIAREFKGMVRLLHEAGIEVYLDVVYNHTADQGDDCPAISFAGIDRASYYRQLADGRLMDVTGCGNSVNTSVPAVQRLVLDSLRYWVTEFGIDGFRFDLAATLGRDESHTFTPSHPLFTAMANDEVLQSVKLIAEPWDVGIGGWQTGKFPIGWSEWNDEYRDRLRKFWVDSFAQARITGHHREGLAGLSTAMAGSSDQISDERGPLASVNLVTAHDGFTLHDLVSYNVKHNLMNGELGRDGSSDNHSYNFGYEGETPDLSVRRDRRLAVRNLLGTLLISSGVPMIVAGDEMGRTQHGNNNPYNQDNAEFGWVSWHLEPEDERLLNHVRRLTAIRREYLALRPTQYNHTNQTRDDSARLEWFDALGQPMNDSLWHTPVSRSLQYIASTRLDGDGRNRVLVIIHGVEDPAPFRLPRVRNVVGYRLLWDSNADDVAEIDTDAMSLMAPGSRIRIAGPSMRLYAAVDE